MPAAWFGASSIAAAGVLLGCLTAYAAVPDGNALRERARALFGAVARVERELTPGEALGRRLFFDPRTAADGRSACVACHLPERFGADGLRFSTDARGKQTSRNSPGILNLDPEVPQRWLADRPDAAVQATGSLTGSMGWASADEAVEALSRLGYAEEFRRAYPDESEPLSAQNFGRALAAFQATLAAPGDFDRWLAGEDRLGPRQRRGLELFMDAGCAACHQGPLFGGRLLQKFGVHSPYWELTGSNPVDEGRIRVTKEEPDRYVFRVPPLRNVAETAPYFHDGSVDDLGRAVEVMARLQVGRPLPEEDVEDIVAFLHSLTGEVPAHFSAPPAHPAGAASGN